MGDVKLPLRASRDKDRLYGVIVEDGDGYTCFEWIRGKGVTFGTSMEDVPP